MNAKIRNFSGMILAGIVGAVVTILAFQLTGHNTPESIVPDGLFHQAGTNKTTLSTPSVSVPNLDFTVAAELAMPAVVQIRARESDALAQQRRDEQKRNDPWSQFFDFDFGGDMYAFPFFQPQPRQGAGSGVIISPDGHIVTNNHVIDFADEVIVRTYDGEEFTATIIGRDPSTDLAVIKVDATDLPTLEYGNSDEVKVGEWVLAVGNPFEYLTSTVTAGIVSAIGRDIDIIRGEKAIEQFIQTDAAINPGNSGGALVDSEGRLIGINTAIASYTGNYAGYSFAIPVNLMMRIADDIIANGGGVIERTSLGVYVDELNDQIIEELDIDVSEGLVIRSLDPGSSAEYAGLLPNDVIVEVDGDEISSFDILKEKINYAKVGDELDVKVLRNGKYEVIPVRLRKRL